MAVGRLPLAARPPDHFDGWFETGSCLVVSRCCNAAAIAFDPGNLAQLAVVKDNDLIASG